MNSDYGEAQRSYQQLQSNANFESDNNLKIINEKDKNGGIK